MLNSDAIFAIAVMSLFAIAVVSWNVRWAFEAWVERDKPEARDEDELIEVIQQAAADTIDALAAIEQLHRLGVLHLHDLYARHGARPDVDLYVPVPGAVLDDIEPLIDLTKRDSA